MGQDNEAGGRYSHSQTIPLCFLPMEKPFYALSESATLLGYTIADLIHLAASEEIAFLIGVPDGIRFQVFDADANRTEAPALLEPQLLRLSATQCQKIQLNGRTEQSDFRQGYLIAPSGSLQLLKPSYGKAGRLEHAWAFWRTCKGPYVKEIELTPERLVVVGDDVRRLLEAQTKSQVKAKPKKQEEKTIKQVSVVSHEEDTAPLVQIQLSAGQEHTSETIPNGNIDSSSEPAGIPAAVAAQTILRRTEVEARTGLKRSTIYDKLDPESPRYDATFPKRVSLGTSAVGWLESEVDAWVASRQVVSKTNVS